MEQIMERRPSANSRSWDSASACISWSFLILAAFAKVDSPENQGHIRMPVGGMKGNKTIFATTSISISVANICWERKLRSLRPRQEERSGKKRLEQAVRLLTEAFPPPFIGTLE